MTDLLKQCRDFCGENSERCSSGDTCVQTMHDEPCIGALGDEIERLRDGLTAIRKALEDDPSAKAVMIRATCDGVLPPERSCDTCRFAPHNDLMDPRCLQKEDFTNVPCGAKSKYDAWEPREELPGPLSRVALGDSK